MTSLTGKGTPEQRGRQKLERPGRRCVVELGSAKSMQRAPQNGAPAGQVTGTLTFLSASSLLIDHTCAVSPDSCSPVWSGRGTEPGTQSVLAKKVRRFGEVGPTGAKVDGPQSARLC